MYFECVIYDAFVVFCHNTLLKNVLQLRNTKINYYTQKKGEERGKHWKTKEMTKGEVHSQEFISSYKFYFQIASLSNALSCATIDHIFFSALKWGVLQRGNSGHLSICKKWRREITKEHRHLCFCSQLWVMPVSISLRPWIISAQAIQFMEPCSGNTTPLRQAIICF